MEGGTGAEGLALGPGIGAGDRRACVPGSAEGVVSGAMWRPSFLKAEVGEDLCSWRFKM